jgi:hypothetical protein
MPEPILFPDERLSLAALEQVDEVCLRFENAWREGLKPRLEEYLKSAQGEERVVLLRELLPLDLDYRVRGGEKPYSADYESRLPQEKNLIQAVFQARVEGHPPTDERDFLEKPGHWPGLAGRLLSNPFSP